MVRVWLIVGAVGVFMATAVASASPVSEVRIPVTMAEEVMVANAVVVVPGDHLWKISAHHLGEGAADDVISPYWLRVIDVNTPNLRSGDPDLIYPGEIVELPPIERR